MADDVIRIQFGVAGGESISKESGLRIKQELSAIAKQIALKINIDRPYFSKQLTSLKKEIDSKLGKLKITINTAETSNKKTSSGGQNGSGAQKQSEEYTALIKQLNECRRVAKTTYSSMRQDTELYRLQQRDTEEALASLQARMQEAKDKHLVSDDEAAKLDQLKAELDQLIAKTKEYTLARTKDKEAAEEQARVASEAAAQDQQAKRLQAMQGSYDKLYARAVEGVGGRYADIIKSSKEAQGLYNDLLKVAEAYRQALNAGNFDEATQKQKELSSAIAKTGARLSELEVSADTVGKKFIDTLGNKVIQTLAYAVIGAITRAVKQIYDNVVKIDKAMTQLKIVTNASAKAYEKFGKNVAKVAQSIGASITDLINSTTVFARLGYGLDEAALLAEKTTVYSRVAAVDVNEATTNITAIVKAFGIEASELENVIDQLIYVGNHYAISSSEIGEAMNNAASALAANGNTLQQAIGIVTAANVTLQNVSKASTAVRTIAARISASTAQLEELGEETTGLLSTADLADKMSAFGVSILNANGQLRSTYDILADLAGRWEYLTTVERAAVAEMMAGTRQQNAFYSIMQNWQDAASIVQQSSAAYGSLQRAQEQYLDSIEGKVEQLGATWEDFSQNLLDSGLVKALVDILNVIGKVLDFIVSVGDGTLVQIGIIALVMVAVSKLTDKLGDLIVKNIDVSISLDGAGNAGKRAAKGLSSAAKSAIALGTAFAIFTILSSILNEFGGTASDVAKIVIGALAAITAAILAFESSNPFGWIALAISGVVMAIQGIVDLIHANSFDGMVEKAQEAREAWEKLNDTLDETTDKLEEIEKQIYDLEKQEKESGGLTLVDKKQLQYLKQAETQLKNQQRTQQKDADDTARTAAQATKNAVNKLNGKSWWWSKSKKEEVNDILSNWIDTKEASGGDIKTIEDYLQDYSDAIGNYEYQIPQVKTTIDVETGERVAVVDENGNPVYERDLQDWQKEVNAMLDEYYTAQDKYSVAIGDIPQAWASAFSRIKYSGATEILSGLANELNVTGDSLRDLYNNNPAVKEFIDYLQEIGLFSWDDQEAIDGLVQQIRALRNNQKTVVSRGYIDILEGMEEEYDLISDALEDMKELGILSRETIEKLINDYPELMNSLQELGVIKETDAGYIITEDENGNSTLDAWVDKRRKDFKEAIEKARDYYNETLAAYEDGRLNEADLSAAEDSLNNAIENLQQFEVVVATLGRSEAIEKFTDQLKKQQEALEDQLDKYKELIEIRRDLLETYQEEVKYQKELAAKQRKVADLQTQVALARLDRSASGQARARELEAELQTAQEDLEDYTLDKAIDDLTAQLDDDLDEYEKFIQAQIDIIAEKLDNIVAAFNAEYGEPKVLNVETHHSGGFVGNKASLDSNERFAKLLKGELVVTPSQMDNFMRGTMPKLQRVDGGSSAVVNNNSPLIQIRCGVVDKDTLPELDDLVNRAVDKIEKNMESALSRTGYKKKY